VRLASLFGITVTGIVYRCHCVSARLAQAHRARGCGVGSVGQSRKQPIATYWQAAARLTYVWNTSW
jgi:hypothetical protein